MNKHTPGPWHYVMDVTNGGGSDPVNMVSYRIYALGHKQGLEYSRPCLGTLNGAGASEADAALIAAAPELLKAAEDAQVWMDSLNMNIAAMGIRTRMRAAISKAKGIA